MSKKINAGATKLNSMLKSIKSKINVKNIVIVLLMPLLFVSFVDTLEAQTRKNTKKKKPQPRKVRTISPAQSKANSIAILQTSEKLTELAKLEPKAIRESAAHLTNQNENLEAISTQDATVLEDIGEMSDVDLLRSFLFDFGEYEDDEEFIGEMGEDLAELEAEDDVFVDVDDFRSIWLLAIGGGESMLTSYGTDKQVIMDLIMKWIGTPYRFGGNTRRAIDCSAWVRAIFYQADSIILPRTAREQVHLGHRVSRDRLEFGDLVFFHTYSRRFASHVGIYLGDNLFAHASSRAGVTVSSLQSTYYARRFIGGRRFSESDYASYKSKTNIMVLD